MYIPSIEQIKSRQPTFNSFYRAPNDVTKYPAQIANAARQNEGMESRYTYLTLKAMVESPWNHHMVYSNAGYENYPFEGFQYARRYSMEPLAVAGSGNNYPVVWIPDPDNPMEPEQFFEPQVVPPEPEMAPMPTGFDPITHAPEPEGVEQLPIEVVESLVDVEKPTIILEPQTQAAKETLQLTNTIPTVEEAVMIQTAVNASEAAAAVLDDPYASYEEKKAAIVEITELSKIAEVAPPEVIEAQAAEAIEVLDEQYGVAPTITDTAVAAVKKEPLGMAGLVAAMLFGAAFLGSRR